MRQVLQDIAADQLPEAMRRLGIEPSQRLHVTLETVEEQVLPIMAINAGGRSFDWLADEPELYGDDDLIERYKP